MIAFNGLSTEDVLSLPPDLLDAEVVNGRPLVLRVGTADVLGRFWVERDVLVVELGHIDGGGEGVLPAIAVLAQLYARNRGLRAVDWRFHAVTCREPNLKLRRMLDRCGLVVEDVPGTGLCYHMATAIGRSPTGGRGPSDAHGEPR